MDNSVFESSHYKPYLAARTGGPGTRKGIKTALAQAIGCQPTYLSQVLHGDCHLSLEQAEGVNAYFGHSSDESAFFFLLVQKDRAGTPTLVRHFQSQMDELLKARLVLTKRLDEKKSLGREEQATYYSSWIYAAVHMALTIPALREREALATYLHLPVKKVTEALDFLLSVGLAQTHASGFRAGETHIRLGNDSPNIMRHHANWRTQAIESLDREQLTDLHYSGTVSLSRADVVRIKNLLFDAIASSQRIVRDSPEEELMCMNVDFFSLKR